MAGMNWLRRLAAPTVLRAVSPAGMGTLLMLSMACLGMVAFDSRAAEVPVGVYAESGGQEAEFTIDCLVKGKACGSFCYHKPDCKGDLVYTGETALGYEFKQNLQSGACLPGCTVQISADFSRYVEICRTGRNEGSLKRVESTSLLSRIAAAVGLKSRPAAAAPTPAAPVVQQAAAAAKPVAAQGRAPDVSQDSVMTGTYTVDKVTGTATGQVRIDWKNGDRFEGQMVDGRRVGKGRFTWANGAYYDGDWVNDIATGRAEIGFSNGDRYVGEVTQGVPNGQGVKTVANGDSLDGHFVNGVVDGRAVFVGRDGSRYDGEWRAGRKNGTGHHVWPDGQAFTGSWVDDKPEGKGVLKYASGDSYDGMVKAGKPNGKGLMVLGASGDRYVGDFVDGLRQGAGTYQASNGDRYVGSWQGGVKSGQGRYTWASGDYWEGEFAEDKPTAVGRQYFATKLDAPGSNVSEVARQAAAATAPAASPKGATGAGAVSTLDRTQLLAIPMVAKELRICGGVSKSDCRDQVASGVVGNTLFKHAWKTMVRDKDKVFDVDTQSVLENGNVFSWLRSGDSTSARQIGIKYDCQAQSLQIQLIYHCTGLEGASCTFDEGIEKYAGRVMPAAEIKSWFVGACQR